MNSKQLTLAAELMAEYEQGQSPAWEYQPIGCHWRSGLNGDALKSAVICDNEIRRVDPYQHLKDAWNAGKRIRLPGRPWRSKEVNGERWFAWDSGPELPELYEIEPDFTLPPPPPGREWHRDDEWTREMLPEGYRPLLVGETGSYECSKKGIDWIVGSNEDMATPSHSRFFFFRTNRPLQPTLKSVPLGPEDVPPFSAIRRKIAQNNNQEWHWRCISYVTGVGVHCADRAYNWEELQKDYEINRSIPEAGKWNPDAWGQCSKEVQA